MANINLLPWREERRQELKKEFLVVLGIVAVVAVALILIVNRAFNMAIDHQQERNAYLQTHINELNRQVAEIRELDAKRRELVDRMRIIQDLQGTRPLIVRVFDELVRTLPDGVFYQSMTRANAQLDFTGIAESNTRVSSLMRQLDGSEWFESPNLTSVQAAADFGEQASSFRMTARISMPESAEPKPAAQPANARKK
jgi:type IV pilus assembly protein PilN